MALQGNYIHYTYENHPTETETITVTYPSDLSSDHPVYEKRGTSEEITQPTIVESTQTFENCYIAIDIASISYLARMTSSDGTSSSINKLQYIWKVFNSQSDRYTNPDSYLLRVESVAPNNWDWSLNTNPFEEGYTALKGLKGAEELVNI
jgi:hypothetical protein